MLISFTSDINIANTSSLWLKIPRTKLFGISKERKSSCIMIKSCFTMCWISFEDLPTLFYWKGRNEDICQSESLDFCMIFKDVNMHSWLHVKYKNGKDKVGGDYLYQGNSMNHTCSSIWVW